MGIPAYNNSCPRSSQMEVMKEAGFRMRPSSLAHEKSIGTVGGGTSSRGMMTPFDTKPSNTF